MSLKKEADKVAPGVMVGTILGAAFTPSLPVVIGAAVFGGLISYYTSEDDEK